MILAPTTRRVIRPYDEPSFVHTQRYSLVRGHWANEGRVGLWLFNEGSGNTVFDLSGNGHHGIIKNNMSWGAGKTGPKLIGSAGSNDHVDCGMAYSILQHPEVTIIMGIRENGTPGSLDGILNAAQTGNNSRDIAIRHATGPIVEINGQTVNWKSSYRIGSDWVSLGIIMKSGLWAIYENGILQDSTDTGVAITNTYDNNLYFAMDYQDGFGRGAPIDIEFAMIYNRALSASEIAELSYNPFLGIERRTRISYFFIPAAVGGINYEEFFEDGVGIVDSMNRIQDLSRTITDGVGTADTIGRTQVQLRTLAETLGLTDTIWKAETRIFADAVGIADAVTKAQAFARTIADDIGLIDSESELMTHVRTLAETLGITDVMSKTVDFPRTISDDVGITDSVTRTAAFARVVAEAMGIEDVVTKTQVQLRTIADTMGLTDAMTPGQLIVFAEAMGMNDAMTHTKTQIRTIADSLGITDDLTRIATYVFTQSDDVGIGDAMIRVAVALRTISDDVGMTDTMSSISELVKAAWAFMLLKKSN